MKSLQRAGDGGGSEVAVQGGSGLMGAPGAPDQLVWPASPWLLAELLTWQGAAKPPGLERDKSLKGASARNT